MRHCPNCGEPLNDSDTICKNCGVFLGSYLEKQEKKESRTPIENEENEPQEEKPEKKKKLRWQIPLLFLLLGVLAILIKLVLNKVGVGSETISSILDIITLVCWILIIPKRRKTKRKKRRTR